MKIVDVCSYKKIIFYLICLLILLMFGFFSAQPAWAADKSLDIVVKIGDKVQLTKTYNQAALNKYFGLTVTKESFTSLDSEGVPELVLAEGVLLTDFLQMLKIDLQEVKSIRFYNQDGRSNSFIKNFLLDSMRYSYPNLIPAWLEANNQQIPPPQSSSSEDNPSGEAQNNSAGDSQQISDQASNNASTTVMVDDKELEVLPLPLDPQKGFKPVKPLLALKIYSRMLATAEDWTKLANGECPKICYGQLNPNDVCSTMYGNRIRKIEIKLSPESHYGKTDAEIKAEKKAAQKATEDRKQQADKIIGSVTDEETGKTIANLPDSLQIKVGYFGYPYTERIKFTLEDLKAMPQVQQAYTLVDDQGRVIMETAMGVRLTDILSAAGIDINAVEILHFSTVDNPESPPISINKSYLLSTSRYFYAALPGHWLDGQPQPGAAAGKVPVDAIIAYRDLWQPGATVPDFYKADGKNRFRLVFGQVKTNSQTADKAVKWIHTIEIQLSGTPPKEEVKTDQSDKLLSSVPPSNQNQLFQEVKKEDGSNKQKIASSQSAPQQEESLPKWHVYEMADQAEALQFTEENPQKAFLLFLVLSLFILGLGKKYLDYRKEF